MSIWSSVAGEEILGLDNLHGSDETDTNYKAEGTPSVWVHLATAVSWHDHIRLGVGDEDAEVLLSPKAARLLHEQLGVAIKTIEDTQNLRPPQAGAQT